MPRRLRKAPGGLVYHALNRGNGRMPIFKNAADYERFEQVLAEAMPRQRMRVLTYCLMPNHWHLVLWPREDDDLSNFMQWLTVTHVRRCHAQGRTAGHGHLYQGRFKSFPIEQDVHFLTVCRYVERNALRARLTRRAEQWRWGGLWRRENGTAQDGPALCDWPVKRPRDWIKRVNTPQTAAEEDAVRASMARGRPLGRESWVARVADRLGLVCPFAGAAGQERSPPNEKTEPNPFLGGDAAHQAQLAALETWDTDNPPSAYSTYAAYLHARAEFMAGICMVQGIDYLGLKAYCSWLESNPYRNYRGSMSFAEYQTMCSDQLAASLAAAASGCP